MKITVTKEEYNKFKDYLKEDVVLTLDIPSGEEEEEVPSLDISEQKDTEDTTLKYELTTESIQYFGCTLYRIKALKDFSDVKKGDLGGFIESEENLSHDGDCWIYGNAKVFDNAQVSGDAHVYGYTPVSGKAEGFWNALICGNAQVFGKAWVYGNAQVSGNALVSDNAEVSGNAQVFGDAQVYGYARVSGNAQVSGEAEVYGNAWVSGEDVVYGGAHE